jgi:hypothetical protein
MAEFDAYAVDTVLLKEEDRKMVATLVDKSAVIRDGYSKCTDEKNKKKLAMEYHTTRRSFGEFVFCCAGDKEERKAAVKGGLVFSLAEVQTLWSANTVGILKTHGCSKSPSAPALSLEAAEQRKAL